MRRMITGKQVETVEKLDKNIKFNGDDVIITAPYESEGDEVYFIFGDPEIEGTPGIYFNDNALGYGFNLGIYDSNEDRYNRMLTIKDNDITIYNKEVEISKFGHIEEENYSINYAGMPGLYSAHAKYLIELYVRDQNDNEIIFSRYDYKDKPATLEYYVIMGTVYADGDNYKGMLSGRAAYLQLLGEVKTSLVTQLNNLQPTKLYMRVVGHPWDEYAFKGINVKIDKNVFKWDVDKECLVLDGTWQALNAQYLPPTIRASLQADLAEIGWYNS